MKSIHEFIFGFIIFLPIVLTSQNLKSIEKSTFLEKVATKNISLKKSLQEIEKAKADYQQSAAVFLPNIGVSHTALLTTNPLMAFGSKLNQGILTQNDFNPTLLNNPVETRNFATVIQVEQPLINLDGFYQRKAVKTALEATELKAARTKEYMLLEAEKAYMNLQVSYKYKSVLEKASGFVDELLRQTNKFYEQGIIQKTDVLAVKIRSLEIKNTLQKAESQIINASNYVAFLMNESANIVLKPADSLQVETVLNNNYHTISSSRADIKALELVSETNKNMLTSNKMSYLPKLNAFGSYELYDNKIFQGGANGYVVGAQLSWDIFQGSKRIGKIQKSKAAFEQSKLDLEEYKSQSNLELEKAKRMLLDAKNNISLTKVGLEQAEEILRIKNNRYQEGLEKITDVLQAETNVAKKGLAYYQAIFEYNYTLNYMNFLIKEN